MPSPQTQTQREPEDQVAKSHDLRTFFQFIVAQLQNLLRLVTHNPVISGTLQNYFPLNNIDDKPSDGNGRLHTPF